MPPPGPDLQAESFIQGDDQLQGIDRVQPQAPGTEQRLVVAEYRRRSPEASGSPPSSPLIFSLRAFASSIC